MLRPGRFVLAIAAAILGSLAAHSAAPAARGAAAPEEVSRDFVLDNGLRVFLLQRRTVPLLHIAAAFDVGSKDETAETSGLVHLLEHAILFRGTATRSGAEIGRDVRRHGAYFNAHTGYDLAQFEISLPAEYADFALRNQKEILFGLELTQADLDEEKEVVLEELAQIGDDPLRAGLDLVQRALFPDHPYARPIYGDPEVIRSATVEGLKAFHARYFVPGNGALAAVGDFDPDDLEAKIREVFGGLPKTAGPPRSLPAAVPPRKAVEVRRELDIQDAYVFIGFAAPDYNHPDQFTMDVLTEVLGRGVHPLLNTALRGGRRDLVQNMSMSYFAHHLGGAVVVTMILEPANAAAAAREAIRFLRQSRNQNFSPDDMYGDEAFYAFDFLGSAKNRIRFGAEQAQESGPDLAGSLARHMILRRGESGPRYLDAIEAVASGDLRKAAAAWFSRAQPVTVTIAPGPAEPRRPKRGAEEGKR